MPEKVSPKFLQTLINSIRDSIKIVDRDLNVVFANTIAEQRLGRKKSELIGKKCYREFYGNNQQCDFCITSRVFQNGGEERLEYQSADEQGEKRFFEMAVFPVHERGGEINFVIEITRDITDRKRFEHELFQSEKLVSLGLVAASVAHEIRNPLTGIRLGLNALGESVQENPRDKDIIDSITTDIKRLDRVLNQLLDFARKKDPSKELLDFSEIVQETVSLINHEAESFRVDITVTVSDDLPAIFGDRDQLKQVMLNLFLNAIQAMPAGGTLSVDVVSDSIKEQQGIEIKVTDTGDGIPSQARKHIYDPFYSTKIDGTGVGLSISYNIIKDHGGRITVDSEEGKGAVFTIFLPKQFQA